MESTEFLLLHCFQVELECRNVGFCGGRKTGAPGEKPLEQGTRTNNKLNPHMTPRPGIEPGPHWWEASAPPLRHPCSPIRYCSCNTLLQEIAIMYFTDLYYVLCFLFHYDFRVQDICSVTE